MKKFFKKAVRVGAALACAALLACLSACGQKRALKVKDFTLKTTKIYYNSFDEAGSLDLYFSKATGNIPYVDLVTSLNKLFDNEVYSVQKGGADYTVVRMENGASVKIDPKKKDIVFSDYDLFKKRPGAAALLDIVGRDDIIRHCQEVAFDTRGAPIIVHYGTFLIDIAIDKSIALLPLQTFSDIFLAGNCSGVLLYNGDELFYVEDASVLFKGFCELTEFGKQFYSADSAQLDKELAGFNLRELALNLQLNYGLKELRGIDKFSDWLEARDLAERLASTDSNEVDLAVKEICYQYFGDIHSSFEAHSPFSKIDIDKEKKENEGIQPSPSYRRINQSIEDAMATRSTFYPNGVPGIQRIDDTVYVTFDHFSGNGRDYFEAPLTDEEWDAIFYDYPSSGIDTYGLIHAANEVIQEDPKIRNVVVDISCNTGGSVDAEVFTACWLLGLANLQIQSGVTGCQSASSYLADVNFDGEFSPKDNVRDRRLFCVVSDITFSCGNLLASTLKESGKATLIGSKTGGGGCAVYSTSTAIGTFFKTSSHFRFSAEKNGMFKDIDDGVSPDYKLTELRSFYNRSDKHGLTAFIKKLY